jgi:predicted aconitase with swiveling domain
MHRGRIKLILKGRRIYKGVAIGKPIITSQNISFYGGVDPNTGIVTEKDHELEGKNIANKILAFPTGKGSTVGSYILYRLKKNNRAPAAIINEKCDPIVAVGCIISEIPCVDNIEIKKISEEALIEVDGNKATIKINKI